MSKQASYETMQKEWNEAKNKIKELKVELAIYKQLAYSFETSLYNALSKKEVEYIRALKAEKEVIRSYLGCDENQTILERLDQFKAELLAQEAETLKAGEIIRELKSEIKELKRKNASERTSLRKKQSLITQLKADNEKLKEKLDDFEFMYDSLCK